MKLPRLTIRDAVRACRREGLIVQKSKDGHWQILLHNRKVVIANRPGVLVPPQISRFLRDRN